MTPSDALVVRRGWYLASASANCSHRSSELHKAKKDIKSEVEERYLLNAEEIAQVQQQARRELPDTQAGRRRRKTQRSWISHCADELLTYM